MVLAYALAGNVQVDLEHESISSSSQNVSIGDLWPTREEVEEIEDESITKKVLHQMDEKIQVTFKRIVSYELLSLSSDGQSTVGFTENTLA